MSSLALQAWIVSPTGLAVFLAFTEHRNWPELGQVHLFNPNGSAGGDGCDGDSLQTANSESVHSDLQRILPKLLATHQVRGISPWLRKRRSPDCFALGNRR